MPKVARSAVVRRAPKAHKRRAYGISRKTDALGTMPGVAVSVPRAAQSVKSIACRITDGIRWVDVGAGTIVPQFNSTSDGASTCRGWMTASGNWTGGVLNQYDEYQPRRVTLKYEPLGRYQGNPAPAQAPILMIYDNDGSAPSPYGSYAMSQYRTGKLVNTADPWEVTYEVPLSAKGLWYDVANTSAWLAQVAIGQGLAPPGFNPSAVGYAGTLYIEVEILVRGPK